MINKYKKIAFVVLIPLLFTSCWDYMDVNKRDIIISIGVDDINDNVQFTGEAAKVTSTSSQIKGTMESYPYEALGKYFEGARSDYDSEIPGPYFAGATRCVVFSEKFSRKGVEAYINRLNSVVGFRNSVLIVISKEPPKQLFSKKIENDMSMGYAIDRTIRHLADNGAALYTTVQEIKSDIDFKNIGYFIPYVTVDENTIKYLGMAAMKDSKLVGLVNRANSSGFIFLISEKPRITRAMPSPKNKENMLAIHTTMKKRKIKTKYVDNKINIFIDLKLKSQLQYEYTMESLSNDDIKKLETEIANNIKTNILSAIMRSQNEFKCDVFGFARYFKADNAYEYKHLDWSQEYPKAIFHVNVSTTIKNTNLLDPNAKKAN